MSWRLRIRHETKVSYDGQAHAQYNEARMIPLTTPEQTTLEARIATQPATTAWRYWDYWGTQVSVFDLQQPHDRLVVNAVSTVEADAPVLPKPPSWAEILAQGGEGRLYEWLQPTPLTTVSPALVSLGRDAVAGADPHEAAAGLGGWVRENVAYVPGSTGVQTSAQEAWELHQGVCQDLAHLTVGLLRGLGIPARYVSGYLHADPDAGIGDRVEGQSHAWVEYWAGAWVGTDPTNSVWAADRHVVVGRGRDYSDVPPLKGIYHGAPSSTLEVTVEVTRLA
jgi:transglutaminase-like putative cysteine protease